MEYHKNVNLSCLFILLNVQMIFRLHVIDTNYNGQALSHFFGFRMSLISSFFFFFFFFFVIIIY